MLAFSIFLLSVLCTASFSQPQMLEYYLPRCRQPPVPSTFYQVNYLFILIIFETLSSELLAESSNKEAVLYFGCDRIATDTGSMAWQRSASVPLMKSPRVNSRLRSCWFVIWTGNSIAIFQYFVKPRIRNFVHITWPLTSLLIQFSPILILPSLNLRTSMLLFFPHT
jgi:hypothetical protein